MRQFLTRWGPLLGWAVVIYTFSSLPTLPKAEVIWWDFILKKTAHIVEYGILYFLLLRALTNTGTSDGGSPAVAGHDSSEVKWLIALGIGILYALSDEFHQSFVMGRTAKLSDVGFDTVGMLLSRLIIGRKK